MYALHTREYKALVQHVCVCVSVCSAPPVVAHWKCAVVWRNILEQISIRIWKCASALHHFMQYAYYVQFNTSFNTVESPIYVCVWHFRAENDKRYGTWTMQVKLALDACDCIGHCLRHMAWLIISMTLCVVAVPTIICPLTCSKLPLYLRTNCKCISPRCGEKITFQLHHREQICRSCREVDEHSAQASNFFLSILLEMGWNRVMRV